MRLTSTVEVYLREAKTNLPLANNGCRLYAFEERGEVFLPLLSPHEAKCIVVCMRCWTPVRRCTVSSRRHICFCVWLLESVRCNILLTHSVYNIFYNKQIKSDSCGGYRRAVPYSCSLRRSRRRRLFRDTLLSPKRHIKRDGGSTSWYPCNPLHTPMLTHQIINCKKYVYIVSNYFHLTFKIFHCFL